MARMRGDEGRASRTGRFSMVVDVLAGRRASLAFKLSYLALAILSWNFLTANTPLLTVISLALAAFGFVLLAARALRFSRFRRTCGLVLLVLFCISYVVSSAAVARYGVLSNVQGFVWLSLQCFALFAYDASASPCDLRRDAEVFSGVFVVVTFVMAFVGLVMAFVGYTYVGSIGYLGSSVGGMFGGRLFGFYSDVNLGAVCALVSALLSVAALCKGCTRSRVRASVAFLVANIVVEFAYVGLSALARLWLPVPCPRFLLCLLLSARHKPKVALDCDSKGDDSAGRAGLPSSSSWRCASARGVARGVRRNGRDPVPDAVFRVGSCLRKGISLGVQAAGRPPFRQKTTCTNRRLCSRTASCHGMRGK